MSTTKQYEVSATVEFIYDPAKVDPFYYVGDGKRIWRMKGIYSQIATEDEMWKHLAYNALVNGVDDASHLDGWGDLDRGELVMRVVADIEEC